MRVLPRLNGLEKRADLTEVGDIFYDLDYKFFIRVDEGETNVGNDNSILALDVETCGLVRIGNTVLVTVVDGFLSVGE